MLKRNCSLAPSQLAVWFGFLALVSFAIAMIFAAMGAWLVVPFAIIEMTVLAIAFFMFGRHAADYEKIVAEPGKIYIETSLGPRLDRIEHQAPWFRVNYSGRHRDLIQVVGPGQTLPVGRFVPGSIRGKLAGELRTALTSSATQVARQGQSAPVVGADSAQY